MTYPLRVGIVGASPKGSWATAAHVPAIAALPGIALNGICTAHLETAQESAAKFGVPLAFADPAEMAAHPDIDIVSVCVRVPAHKKLVDAAIAGGNHVYCEWPLGRDTEEAVAMTAAAKARGIVAMVGLQSRRSPALKFARDLIARGEIGEVHGSTFLHSAPWLFVNTPVAYLDDLASGAHFLSIPGGHAIDAFTWLLGDFASLTAILKRVELGGAASTATSPNQVAINGVLKNGAVATVRLQGAPKFGTGIRWEINGSAGDLVITTNPAGRGIQMSNLVLSRTTAFGVLEEIPVPDAYQTAPEAVRAGPAGNVAGGYTELLSAIAEGRDASPAFEDGVRLHRLLDAIQQSSRDGVSVELH